MTNALTIKLKLFIRMYFIKTQALVFRGGVRQLDSGTGLITQSPTHLFNTQQLHTEHVILNVNLTLPMNCLGT